MSSTGISATITERQVNIMEYGYDYGAYLHSLDFRNDYEPSYEQQEYRRSYAIGTDHQYEMPGPDSSSFTQIHINDSEENRNEFNRRFNALIQDTTNLWHNDTTPPEERNASYYAHRYRLFFHKLVLLLETFPDAGDNNLYWDVVHTWEYYRELCAYYAGVTPPEKWKYCNRLNNKRR